VAGVGGEDAARSCAVQYFRGADEGLRSRSVEQRSGAIYHGSSPGQEQPRLAST
jgi:hypothetical protein